MECILCGWGRIGYSDVSIHALTRGATGAVGHYGFHKEVSIHASTRGATNSQILFTMSLVFQSTHPHGVRPLAKAMYLPALQFQSTHPHGVRLDYIKHLHLYQGVSIHAPTRGATKTFFILGPSGRFQSTHPHGVRRPSLSCSAVASQFQSTHPHGVRLETKCSAPDVTAFQSTHPHGVRLLHPIYPPSSR